MDGIDIVSKIDEICTIPRIRECLSLYFHDEMNMILEYFVHYPICNIKTISNDCRFISKKIIDHEIIKYFYDERQKSITFKFYLKHVLSINKYEFQILHMTDDYGNMPVMDISEFRNSRDSFGFIYQFKPKPINLDTIPKIIKRFEYDIDIVHHDCGHEHKFIIPKDDIFNYLIKFLTCSKDELKSMLLVKIDMISDNDRHDLYRTTRDNLMWYGIHDSRGCCWHFKLWIIEFLNEISVYLSYKEYKKDLPIDKDLEVYYLPVESKYYKKWDDFEVCYPWEGWDLLDHSYTFAITYQGKPRKYHFAIYNSTDKPTSKVYHYYIDIRNFKPNKEVLYYRGGIVGKNPVISIIFFLVSRTDEWLDKYYPYIGAEIFRCILLQHIHHINDW